MKRDNNVELFRCICMLGVVCIHAFTWANHPSHGLSAICSASLIGFVMISAWYGIHFRVSKFIRLIATVVACVAIGMVLVPNGGGNVIKEFLMRLRSYWYVWAYVFMMLFSPVVDGFVECCDDARKLVAAFFSVGFLLWGWSFLVTVKVSPYIPTMAGFGDCSGVVLFCVYAETRLMLKIGWIDKINSKVLLIVPLFMISGMFVFMGFRHSNSIFAYLFALNAILLVKRVSIGDRVGRVFRFIAPSMFSVYLLHMPFYSKFANWEMAIYEHTCFPHVVSQFLLAIIVFSCAVILDMPRRFFVMLLFRFPIVSGLLKRT